jgi:hypothetical protein
MLHVVSYVNRASKNPFATQLSRNTRVTMAKSGFGPYHGLWLDDAPTKRIGVIPTPWMMTCALGFIEILSCAVADSGFHDILECAQY